MATNIIYYQDISKIGRDFTGNHDISLLSNEQAVLESVKNIISTEPGERLMYPDFGCALSEYLFEPVDNVTAVLIRKEIENSINKYENRIENLDIDIITNPDTNSIIINIRFNMKTSTRTQTLTLDLNKIR